jgi:nucleoside-diphosphate-sugar epimerase
MMRVLVTGHRGYIGPAMVEALRAAGHEVAGLDSGLFDGCELEPSPAVPSLVKDIRDVQPEDLTGFDAVVHLANLSNDPLGTLSPELTHCINVEATVQLARAAKRAGVRRFLNSSSCSAYGAAVEDWVDESTATRPVTAYGESKVLAEAALRELADARFCVVSFRNATAFGYSPNLRTDLVVNELVAGAILHGEVRLNSDGAAWRPLVHIRDIARAFTRAMDIPAERINREILNVGANAQNYRIRDVAQTIVELVPGATLSIPGAAGADRRSYRVRFDRVASVLTGFTCAYDLAMGVRDLLAQFARITLTETQVAAGIRLLQLQRRLADGELAPDLRVLEVASR